MIEFVKEKQNEKIEIYKVMNFGKALNYKLFFQKLKSDINFRTIFIEVLQKSNFRSYRFETPVVNSSSNDKPFEFVLVNSPELSNSQDELPFHEHMNMNKEKVISFLNLSKTSQLIIPNKVSSQDIHSHIANFVRKGPLNQIHELFKIVGNTVLNSIGSSNIWISTAGGGVDWLHIRIDKSPKYYRYKKYKQI
ncbi:hypothetical protein LNTAR_24843 [Lentisphaera araneosa HTCC2155]|jgi:hypothetical protein|uniref:Uncharacterized protein n=1 Tax=Lentisphaera araneosa HTCC2155 TaxID=313628 RepID=A6DSX6_9BACT|nr:hypothetical protein [Lentisphaera araneosa]EDM25266.1 hypothetical protein LNTAR_24843 [Lentisphaera araneosa HTCC2155]